MSASDCTRVFEKLSEYLDRELPPSDCVSLERHIQGCGRCVEFVESVKQSVALIKDVDASENLGPMPEDVKADLRAAFERMAGEAKSKL